MNICEILAKSAWTELNNIYTERPFQGPGGLDLGWFCREHALHVAALSEMLGRTAHICCGDVMVVVPGAIVISTVSSGSDHAWCRVDDLVPVDASVTLQFFDTGRRDVDVVCPDCPQHLAGFDLQYHVNVPDEAFVAAAQTGKPVIAYNEKKVLRFDYADLLSNPFSFLHPMPAGVLSFQQIHGSDVYFAVTAHLYDLASEKTRPLRRYRDPKSAVRAMTKRYPDARMKLCRLLRDRPAGDIGNKKVRRRRLHIYAFESTQRTLNAQAGGSGVGPDMCYSLSTTDFPSLKRSHADCKMGRKAAGGMIRVPS